MNGCRPSNTGCPLCAVENTMYAAMTGCQAPVALLIRLPPSSALLACTAPPCTMLAVWCACPP